MMIGAGERDKRLIFEILSESVDDDGGLVQTYSEDFKRWGSLRGITGNESYISDQLVSTVSHKIRVIYDSKTKTLTSAKHKIKVSGRSFNISAIINISEKNKELLILAKEVV